MWHTVLVQLALQCRTFLSAERIDVHKIINANRNNNALGQGVHARVIPLAKRKSQPIVVATFSLMQKESIRVPWRLFAVTPLGQGERTCHRAKQPYSSPRAVARLTQW